VRKVAIFVEGLTEVELTVRLVEHLCHSHHYTVEVQRQYGGNLLPVRATPAAPNQAPTIHVTIVNCCSDGQVVTQIKERYAGLQAAGYTSVLGLQDLYPDFSATDVPKLQQGFARVVPQGTIPRALHFAELETEAWFIDEHTHYSRIAPALTVEVIVAAGFDIVRSVGHSWPHPADTLHRIYKLGNRAYKKRGKTICRTVDAMSLPEMLGDGRQRSPSFHRFIASLEASLF
jgi:hypothetical protein